MSSSANTVSTMSSNALTTPDDEMMADVGDNGGGSDVFAFLEQNFSAMINSSLDYLDFGAMDNDTFTTDNSFSGSTDMFNGSTTESVAANSTAPDVVIPFASKVVLIILYTCTTVAAVFGNSLAILVFAKGKRCNTELKFFLINLAVADLIMAIFCIPFTFVYQITGHWVFSDVMCNIVQCCQVVSVTASVYTNTAIGIDRLVAVRFPLRRRVTSSKSKLVIMAIWIFAWSLGVVPLVMAKTTRHGDKVACEESWPDQDSRLAYSFGIMIVTYFLPITILSVTYSSIGKQLWNRNMPGNADDNRDAQQLRSKRKVVKMLATIVLLFGICWLPLHLFMIIITFNINFFGEAVNEIYFGVHWLSMANSFVNPVIYGFMNDNFRADLRNLLQVCWCCSWTRRRLKYRPATGWRLGDSKVQDPHLTTQTLNRHEIQLRANLGNKHRHGWRNGHCHSAPGFDTKQECEAPCLPNGEGRYNGSPNRKIYNAPTDTSSSVGRNIFSTGKKRHFQPCNGGGGQRPNSTDENGFLLMNGSRSSRGSDASRISPSRGQPTIFYDGDDQVMLGENLRKSDV